MSEESVSEPKIEKVYPLRAQFGKGDVSNEADRPGNAGFDILRHKFSLPFRDKIPEEEKRPLLEDKSIGVYRRGLFRKHRGTLDEHVDTGTGGTFRRSTKGILRKEGLRVLTAFVRGSEKTWAAVKFSQIGGKDKITPPRHIDLRGHI